MLVLIETLWNVKQEREEKDMTLAGINRNIVECKDVTSSWKILQVIVLIETLWNVKNGESLDVFTPADVLIETLWNVKRGQVIATPVENMY